MARAIARRSSPSPAVFAVCSVCLSDPEQAEVPPQSALADNHNVDAAPSELDCGTKPGGTAADDDAAVAMERQCPSRRPRRIGRRPLRRQAGHLDVGQGV